ncbi:MAG: hypothetical protein AAB112_05240, partial [Thermodesulfobacteriota bacterium]
MDYLLSLFSCTFPETPVCASPSERESPPVRRNPLHDHQCFFLANFGFDLKLNMTAGDFANHVSRCMSDQTDMQPENIFHPGPTSKS